MENLLLYAVKFSVSLAMLYLFYYSVLSRLTFHHWNRIYLLIVIPVALTVPLLNLNLDVRIFGPAFDNVNSVKELVAEGAYLIQAAPQKVQADPYSWVVMILAFGALLRLSVVGAQYASLRKLRRRSVLLRREKDHMLFALRTKAGPFSFGRAVYFNPDLHAGADHERIVEHELVHVRQRHTFDIIAVEMLCIINWYNPFAWMLRRSVRQNLEFLADGQLIGNGCDIRKYQYALLQAAALRPVSLTTTFSFNHLKKRIRMMNARKTPLIQSIWFAGAFPVIFFLLLIFGNKDLKAQQNGTPGAIQMFAEGGITIIAKDSSRTLYIVDGLRQPRRFKLDRIRPVDIRAVNVWPEDEAVKRFGNAGSNGAIEVKTKLPLYILDGVFQPKTSSLRDLVREEDIESISVYKDKSSLEHYGEIGANGVIEIFTKD